MAVAGSYSVSDTFCLKRLLHINNTKQLSGQCLGELACSRVHTRDIYFLNSRWVQHNNSATLVICVATKPTGENLLATCRLLAHFFFHELFHGSGNDSTFTDSYLMQMLLVLFFVDIK